MRRLVILSLLLILVGCKSDEKIKSMMGPVDDVPDIGPLWHVSVYQMPDGVTCYRVGNGFSCVQVRK